MPVFAGRLNRHCTPSSRRRPIDLLPVFALPIRRNRTLSHGSGVTPMPESSDTKSLVSFAICSMPLFGKSITADDLIEFMEVNRVLGAELFFFYVGNSDDPNVRRCSREYERFGVVGSMPWKPPTDLEKRIPEKGQYFAMTECVYRLMYQTVEFHFSALHACLDQWCLHSCLQ